MYRQRCSLALFLVIYTIHMLLFVTTTWAQPAAQKESPPLPAEAQQSAPKTSANLQNELEAKFIQMLSGATLEGSFTSTAPGNDPTRLSREKYTIGEVTKIAGTIWLIPARIQYGEHDVTLPVTVPVRWAGDTPVIVVDNVGLPGFGKVSARVMFFADHYAGYWQHGQHGGHLFGTISRDEEAAESIAPTSQAAGESESGEDAESSGDSPRGQEPNQQRR